MEQGIAIVSKMPGQSGAIVPTANPGTPYWESTVVSGNSTTVYDIFPQMIYQADAAGFALVITKKLATQ